jgi:hypothetical protein
VGCFRHDWLWICSGSGRSACFRDIFGALTSLSPGKQRNICTLDAKIFYKICSTCFLCMLRQEFFYYLWPNNQLFLLTRPGWSFVTKKIKWRSRTYIANDNQIITKQITLVIRDTKYKYNNKTKEGKVYFCSNFHS